MPSINTVIERLERLALAAKVVYDEMPDAGKKTVVSVVVDRDDIRAIQAAVATLKKVKG